MENFASATHSRNIRRGNYKASAPQEEFIVPLLKDRIEYYIKRYRSVEGGRALDVGCGNQPFRVCIEESRYHYFSLDVVKTGNNEIDFVAPIDQPVTENITKAGPFDLILCTEVLEHIPRWDSVFENFSKLTNEGSYILITCPHFYQLHEEPFDFWRPTFYALQYYAEHHGFEVIVLEKGGDAWDVLGTLLANVKDISVIQRTVFNRILNRIAIFIKGQLFKQLKSRWLQRRLKIHSPIYLSNIVVLKRQ